MRIVRSIAHELDSGRVRERARAIFPVVSSIGRAIEAGSLAAPLIQLRDIALTFGGTPLLDGAELSVSAGERVCLVGRNGSGKSTLLKIAAGLIEPDRGERFLQPGATIRYLPQEPDFRGFATTLRLCRGRPRPGRRSASARAICWSSSG